MVKKEILFLFLLFFFVVCFCLCSFPYIVNKNISQMFWFVCHFFWSMPSVLVISVKIESIFFAKLQRNFLGHIFLKNNLQLISHNPSWYIRIIGAIFIYKKRSYFNSNNTQKLSYTSNINNFTELNGIKHAFF